MDLHSHPSICVVIYEGDELYGYMTLSKDWKDGVLSIIMRGMSKNFSDQVRRLFLPQIVSFLLLLVTRRN